MTGTNKENPLLNRKEAAKLLGIQPGTLEAWQRKGKVKVSAYLNNRPRYAIEDLTALFTTNSPGHVQN